MVASSRAIVTGLRTLMMSTLAPNFSRSVRAAVMAMPAIGSIRQTEPTIRSENQTESHPCSSSVSR